MLSSHFRLKGKKNFDRAKQKGRVYHRSLYAVCIYDRGDVATPRFGFVISTKISKLATQRNRIKRAMQETIRYNLRFVPIGLDIVFLVKTPIAGKSSEEIMKDVEEFIHTMKPKT